MFERAPAIPVVFAPSVDEFVDYLRREQPVVVRGALTDWPPAARWTLEYLKSIHGHYRVKASVSKTGEYADYFERRRLGVDPEVSIAELIDAIFAPSSEADKRRLHQAPLESLPGLDAESPPLAYFPREVFAKNIWMGSVGNVTKTHYDTEDNINVQLLGRKEFVLFPASQLGELYPRSPFDYLANFSRVDVAAPDFARYPRFARAIAMRTVLEPGDFLYIPIYWWHWVRTLEASLNVNFWLETTPRQALRPQGMRFWPRMARDGYLHTHVARTIRQSIESLGAR